MGTTQDQNSYGAFLLGIRSALSDPSKISLPSDLPPDPSGALDLAYTLGVIEAQEQVKKYGRIEVVLTREQFFERFLFLRPESHAVAEGMLKILTEERQELHAILDKARVPQTLLTSSQTTVLSLPDRVRDLCSRRLPAVFVNRQELDPDFNPAEVIPSSSEVAQTVAGLLRGTDLPQDPTLSEAVAWLAEREITISSLAQVIYQGTTPSATWEHAYETTRAANRDRARAVILSLLFHLFGITVSSGDYHLLGS